MELKHEYKELLAQMLEEKHLTEYENSYHFWHTGRFIQSFGKTPEDINRFFDESINLLVNETKSYPQKSKKRLAI